MNDKIIVAPTNNVEGNITSCKIEQQLIRVDRESALSLVKYDTYATYDVCSKKIIDQYQIQSITGYGFFASIPVFFLAMLVPFFVYVAIASLNDKRKGSFGNGYEHL